MVNDPFFVNAFNDTDYLCFTVIDESLMGNHNLKFKKIKTRFLRLADGKIAANTNWISSLDMDIDGGHKNI